MRLLAQLLPWVLVPRGTYIYHYFASVPFLFVFLPAVLAAYFLCPRRWHNAVLLVFSLFFYAWGEPIYILLMLCSITVSFLAGRALGRTHTPCRMGGSWL